MADPVLDPALAPPTPRGRFGAGLTEGEVRRFQTILREQCGVDVPLPEAWSRAIELLSLVEMLLQERGVLDPTHELATEFEHPRS